MIPVFPERVSVPSCLFWVQFQARRPSRWDSGASASQCWLRPRQRIPFQKRTQHFAALLARSDLVFPVLSTAKMEVDLPARHPTEKGRRLDAVRTWSRKGTLPGGGRSSGAGGSREEGDGGTERGPRVLGPFSRHACQGGVGNGRKACRAGAALCPKEAEVAVSFHLFTLSQCSEVAGRYQLGGQGCSRTPPTSEGAGPVPEGSLRNRNAVWL